LKPLKNIFRDGRPAEKSQFTSFQKKLLGFSASNIFVFTVRVSNT
jgi:hypothetical protein